MSTASGRVTTTGKTVRGPDNLEIDVILATFGQSLKSRRTSAGLTRETLAHRTFLRPEQVSLFERGKAEPYLTVLLTLAHALDTTANQILDGLVLAPMRQASSQQMLALIRASPGIATEDLADALRLPPWYVNQNARRLQSLAMIHWARNGWASGSDGAAPASSADD
jgi:transcriptional regulator with XRE-family HTH domain